MPFLKMNICNIKDKYQQNYKNDKGRVQSCKSDKERGIGLQLPAIWQIQTQLAQVTDFTSSVLKGLTWKLLQKSSLSSQSATIIELCRQSPKLATLSETKFLFCAVNPHSTYMQI